MPIVAAIPAIIGAVGAVGSAAIGAHGASKAANAQTQAAQQALALQQPYYQAGKGALQSLSSLLTPEYTPELAAASSGGNLQGIMNPGGLYQQWTGQFNAPTAEQAAQTPGYQFALQQGLNALQNSAAARGTVMNPGTGKALAQYAQGLASNTYQQTFNNALTQYQQSYNQFQQGQQNLYQRLSGLVGVGQNAANASQNALGYQGNAQAAGAINSANAWGGALSNLGSYAMLGQNLYGNSQGNAIGVQQPYNNQANIYPTYMPSSPPTIGTDYGYSMGNLSGLNNLFNSSGYSGIQYPQSPQH